MQLRRKPIAAAITGGITDGLTGPIVGAAGIAVTLTLTGNATTTEGSVYTLNIAVSGDDAAGITGYTVNWGDGSATEAASLGDNTYTYDDGPLSASIVVTALHPNGNKSGSKSVTVNNVVPTATITGDSTATVDVAYTATISSVTDPGDDTVSTYRIYWGDGSSDDYASAGAKTHTYTSAGTGLTVRLDLIDEDGTHANVDSYSLDVSATVTPIHSIDLTTAPSASNAFDDYGLATSRTVTDYNGRIVEIPANAVPMGGLRPVRNLVAAVSGASSEDLTSTGWFATSGASITTVTTWTTSTTNSYVYLADMFGGTPADGRVYAVRLRASVSADCGLRVRVCGLPTAYKSIAAADGTVELAFDVTISGALVDRFDLQCNTSGVTVTSANFQVQDITHRADLSTAPDEFVSTADDYGTGVNGFRYFDTELANTVASNVVTEATGASIAGWLDLQPDSTNLVEDSEDFSETSGTFARQNIIVTVNQSVAPDGSNSADLLDDGTATGTHRVYNSTTVTAGAICCSCYAKVVDQQYLSIRIRTSATNYAWAVFDLVNGTVNGNAAVDNAAIDHDVDGNGWSRIWMSATTDQTSQFAYFEFSDVATAPSVTTISLSYTGSNNQLYLWGAQLETGTIPTAYIPTSGAAASRPAMSPAPTISGLVGTEDARLVVKGCGPELVTNGTFDTDTTGWTPVNSTLSVDAGRLKVTTTQPYGSATQTIAMTAGQSAWISHTLINGSGSALLFAVNATIDGSLLIATADNPVIWMRVNSASIGATAFFDDIHVRVLDPTDTTERTLDIDNTDGEFDTLPSPIKVLSIDVYNDGERPA